MPCHETNSAFSFAHVHLCENLLLITFFTSLLPTANSNFIALQTFGSVSFFLYICSLEKKILRVYTSFLAFLEGLRRSPLGPYRERRVAVSGISNLVSS